MPKLSSDQALAGPPPAELVRPEGTRHHVSFSELATFRDCPLKWQLAYYWRLESPTRDVKLDIGTVFHLGMDTHYTCIREGVGKLETLTRVFNVFADEVEKSPSLGDDELARLRWMYEGYVKLYGSDSAYEILETESDFSFPMPVEGAPDLVIVGKIDLETIHRETGAHEIWDHKSTSQRNLAQATWGTETLLEDQFILYAEAKRRMGTPVAAVLYNGVKSDPLKTKELSDAERFNRIRMEYKDRTLEVVWKEAENVARSLVALWNDPDLVYSVPNPRQCTWKCQFLRPHLEARATGREATDIAISYGFRQKSDKTADEEALEAAEPDW